ncbi:MAG TPA: protein-export chaperone SecB [Burkholderiales bacterium]|nr:protein-export chaperone SecB [Burkholderiales bacterium]
MSEQAQQPQSPQETTQPIFSIEKVYVKDLSLEIPSAPRIFLQPETPQVDINIHTAASVVEAGALYEVVLTATVTAKLPDRTVFLVEVAQAGLFHIRNLPPQDLDAVLGILCPTTLLPYAREAVSNSVARAGFPPVILQHMDFNQVYQQALQQRADQQPAPSQVN